METSVLFFWQNVVRIERFGDEHTLKHASASVILRKKNYFIIIKHSSC
jgi:hypothetical protein